MHRYFGYCILLSVIGTTLFPACKSVKPADAARAQEAGEYNKAADLFRQLYRRTPAKQQELRAYYAFQAGENSLRLGRSSHAIGYYRNAERYKYPDSVIYLHLGQAYLAMGQYASARKVFLKFAENKPGNFFARQGLACCELGLDKTNRPNNFTVSRANALNSSTGEFSPAYAPDGSAIYFSSSRSRDPGLELSAITGLKPNDLYIVRKNAKGVYEKPDSVPGGINTAEDEGTPMFTAGGRTMYYTYAEYNEHYNRTARIFSSSPSGEGGWGKGQDVDIFKDSLSMSAHPAPSPGGSWLYFVSDAGARGGKDIFRCSIGENTIGRAENLGSDINTPGDEMFPYMATDSIMYFASNGHPGYGGLDLFRAELDSLGRWHVENLGRPINSPADDFGFAIDPSKRGEDDPVKMSGLFSSTRGDSKARPHLYTFTLPAVLTYIEGAVYDREGTPIPEASVRIAGNAGPVGQGIVYTRKDGSYRIRVEEAHAYVMLAGAKNYLNQYIRFNTDSLKRNETYYIDFYLASRINPERLNNILYDFDKATLRPESKKSLDELVKVLEDNPDVCIELSSHTDRFGSESYNLNLSNRRAKSVTDYLEAAHIAPSRMYYRGYGKLQPHRVTNKDHKTYPEIPADSLLSDSLILSLKPALRHVADQLNRRTEFRVVTQEEVDTFRQILQKKNTALPPAIIDSALTRPSGDSIPDSTAREVPDTMLRQSPIDTLEMTGRTGFHPTINEKRPAEKPEKQTIPSSPVLPHKNLQRRINTPGNR